MSSKQIMALAQSLSNTDKMELIGLLTTSLASQTVTPALPPPLLEIVHNRPPCTEPCVICETRHRTKPSPIQITTFRQQQKAADAMTKFTLGKADFNASRYGSGGGMAIRILEIVRDNPSITRQAILDMVGKEAEDYCEGCGEMAIEVADSWLRKLTKAGEIIQV